MQSNSVEQYGEDFWKDNVNFDRVSILIFEPYYKVEFNLFFFFGREFQHVTDGNCSVPELFFFSFSIFTMLFQETSSVQADKGYHTENVFKILGLFLSLINPLDILTDM